MIYNKSVVNVCGVCVYIYMYILMKSFKGIIFESNPTLTIVDRKIKESAIGSKIKRSVHRFFVQGYSNNVGYC